MNYSEYIKITSFLQRLKHVHGGGFVDATLRRHSKLKNALQEFEKKHILDIETEILNLE